MGFHELLCKKSNDYGVSESTCYRNCRWVEDNLIKSKKFHLPGKKALLATDKEFRVLLTDATESPLERPKKKSVKTVEISKSTIIPERKNGIRKKLK